MRLLGGSIGVAASFIILNTKIQNTLGSILSPEQLEEFYKSPVAIFSFTGTQKIEVQETYINAFAIDMRMCIGISAASFLVSICTYQRNSPSIKKCLDDGGNVHAKRSYVYDGGGLGYTLHLAVSLFVIWSFPCLNPIEHLSKGDEMPFDAIRPWLWRCGFLRWEPLLEFKYARY